jgi:hypothetical protein
MKPHDPASYPMVIQTERKQNGLPRRIAFGKWLTRADRCLPDSGVIDSTCWRETPGGRVMLDEFVARWEGLEDPRTGNAGLHDFHELLMIALCAVLSGGQGAVDMAEYARAKEPFLRGLLKLAKGLPSHDTFSRLFRQLDPAQFGSR